MSYDQEQSHVSPQPPSSWGQTTPDPSHPLLAGADKTLAAHAFLSETYGPKDSADSRQGQQPLGGQPTFFVDGQWNAVDGLQFDTRIGQHLQLHGRQ